MSHDRAQHLISYLEICYICKSRVDRTVQQLHCVKALDKFANSLLEQLQMLHHFLQNFAQNGKNTQETVLTQALQQAFLATYARSVLQHTRSVLLRAGKTSQYLW